MQEKIKAAINLFHYAVINGNSTVNEDEFDGLGVLVKDSSTEYKPATAVDLSTSALMDTNYSAFLDMMDEFVSKMQGNQLCF